MINQFAGHQYAQYCHGAHSTLEAVAGLLPGPAMAPPDQLAAYAGALLQRRHVASRFACGVR